MLQGTNESGREKGGREDGRGRGERMGNKKGREGGNTELRGRVEEHWVGGIEIERSRGKEFNSSFKMTDEISQ